MGLKWFRLYAEIVNDDKMRLIAFEDRWHFVALCCLKASGVLDETDADLRWQRVRVSMGLADADLEKTLDRLARVKLIDRKTLEPVAWDRRQFVSDADQTNAERQRRYRAKPVSNAPVTDVSRVQKTDTEADTETEEKIESTQLPKSARASRLPPNFPGAAEAAFCKTERPELDAPAVADKFRDYWVAVPGARGRKLDWPATWRNFVRSERGPPRPASGSARNRAVVMDAIFSKPREVIDVEPEPVARRLG